MFSFRIFIGSILIFIHLISCTKAELNGVCDPGSENFLLTSILRYVIDDRSNLCGYKVSKNICDLHYSQVSLPENWNRLQSYFQIKASESRRSISRIYTVSVPSSLGFTVGLYTSGLLPNGKILALPNDPTDGILLFDPLDDSFQKLSVLDTINSRGFILAPNGKAYGLPGPSGKLLIYDYRTNEIRIKNVPTSSLGFNFQGGVIVGNDIYIMNRTGPNVLVYNTENDSFIELGVGPNFSTSAVQFVGAALSSDGRIFAAPANQTNVLVVNPFSKEARLDIVPQVYTNNLSRYHEGASIGMDGGIYMFPRDTSNVLLVKPETNLFQLLSVEGSGLDASVSKYATGKLSPSGVIIAPPFLSLTASNLLYVDTISRKVTLGDSIVPQIYFEPGAWLGSTLSSNGKIYFFSGIVNKPVLVLDIGETFCDSVLLSPYLNNN